MLVITFTNDLRGDDNHASYDVTVRVNDRVLYTGKHVGHARHMGWLALVTRWAQDIRKDRGNVSATLMEE
jgi:predicted hotdog family 3-hydroxylacyl-ACP dehydratase